jgi:phospholipid/cholesterol/gamma-HCH transport system substrate-binding protein
VKRSNEALVGAVILASVIVVTVGTLWLQGVSLRATEVEITAAFTHVGVIRPGNTVKLRGVRIGRVREITVSPEGDLVHVSARIDDAVPLPDDAVAILSPESLFGDWQLEIAPRDRFPEYRYATPRDPDHLPGYSIPDISQLTATADRISADIEILTERVGIAFSEETARNVASLIENVENVTQRLSELVSQQADAFTGVTEELQEASQEIGQAARSAQATLTHVNDLLAREELSQTLEDLVVITENVKEFSHDLDGTGQDIREMAARADSTFAQVNVLLARVEAGEGSIGRLLQDPTMAAEMEGALQELQLLLEDIRENPRRYLRLSIF